MSNPVSRASRMDVMLPAVLTPEAPAAASQVFAFNNRIFHARGLLVGYEVVQTVALWTERRSIGAPRRLPCEIR